MANPGRDSNLGIAWNSGKVAIVAEWRSRGGSEGGGLGSRGSSSSKRSGSDWGWGSGFWNWRAMRA